MLPYFALIGIPALLMLFPYNDNHKVFNKRFPLLVFFVLLILLLSLRSVRCGIDLVNYRNKFMHSGSINFASIISTREYGFGLLMSVCKRLTNNFQFFLFVCALLSIVPIAVLYLRNTKHNLLTIALFVGIAPFSMFFSGLRQSIALGLAAICYYYCEKRKLIPFLLLVFAAFTFHQSAVILLLMYPLMHLRITKKWIIPIAAVFIVCFIYRSQIFGFIMNLNVRYDDLYTINETGSYTFLILLLLMTVYSFLMLKDSEIDSFGLRNFLVFTLLMQCFASVNSVAMRLNYYYLIFIPILIPNVIDNARIRYRQIAKISHYVFVVFFIFWFFKEAYTGADILSVFPYVPFWGSQL